MKQTKHIMSHNHISLSNWTLGPCDHHSKVYGNPVEMATISDVYLWFCVLCVLRIKPHKGSGVWGSKSLLLEASIQTVSRIMPSCWGIFLPSFADLCLHVTECELKKEWGNRMCVLWLCGATSPKRLVILSGYSQCNSTSNSRKNNLITSLHLHHTKVNTQQFL